MGPIQDRTREHLGTTDKVIMAHRRLLRQAIEAVQTGGTAPGMADPSLQDQMQGPDTVDGIAPAGTWADWWQQQAQAKRQQCPWQAPGVATAAGAALVATDRA
jgi:phthalate 4,5-dioxygenase